MSTSEKHLNKFTHIYCETEALDYPLTQTILSRFPDACVIELDYYKEVFCRPRQNFRLQKNSQAIILAVKKGNILYKGPSVCQSFGNDRFYYTSPALNCIYDCEYCFLQGMYPSAHLVVFVNIDDFFSEVSKELDNGPFYLTVSYDTDLLALQGIVPLAEAWADFSGRKDGLLTELRTKSANFNLIKDLKTNRNSVLAWTLTPEPVRLQYEKTTPSLDLRLASAKQAIDRGWKVRLCFDPLLRIDGWKDVYSQFIRHVFDCLPPEKIEDVSLGAFRMPEDYFKKIKKIRFGSELYNLSFDCSQETVCYPACEEQELVDTVAGLITEHIPPDKLYRWDMNNERKGDGK